MRICAESTRQISQGSHVKLIYPGRLLIIKEKLLICCSAPQTADCCGADGAANWRIRCGASALTAAHCYRPIRTHGAKETLGE